MTHSGYFKWFSVAKYQAGGSVRAWEAAKLIDGQSEGNSEE